MPAENLPAAVPCGLHELLADRAERTTTAPALLAPGRPSLDHARLHRHVAETAYRLNGCGVGRTDRVAIVLPNGPEMASAFLGVAAGAVAAPLNPAYRRTEFDFYLADLKARALILQAGSASPARDAAADLGIPVLELAADPDMPAGLFRLEGDAGPAPALPGLARPEDVALVLHTSGTTSRPKLVPLTHANLGASARAVAASLRLGETDRCLNIMPLFHVHGLVAAVLASLAAGAAVVCTPGFDGGRFFAWLREFAPTWFTAVPTMHQAILRGLAGQPDAARAGRLRFLRSCSAPLAPTLLAELGAAFGVPVVEAYGMTEAAHQITCNPLPPRPRKPGSVGVAAGPEVAVMGAAGDLLPPGAVGEVVIRGANVTAGYEANPAANAAAFTRGWFRTGDQGYVDADGYLFLTGRLKELINRGGEKIAPREIDEALLRHPAVAQAVAFGVPHPTLGEDVAAAVVLREGASAAPAELCQFARTLLADFKVPRHVVLLSELPKGPTGKLQRVGLADRLGLTGRAGAPPRPGAEGDEPRTPTEAALARLWCEVLGVERVGIHANFFEAGGDSLLAEALLTRVEGELGRKVLLAAFAGAPTVAQLANFLSGPDPQAPPLTFIPFRPQGARLPFFAVPPPGHGMCFAQLARHLSPDQPFYGLGVPANDELRTSPGRLAEAAAVYAAEVRRLQPEGPYCLGGYSHGGVLAFEMARQLHAHGQEVALLALFDTRCPGHCRLKPASLGRRLDVHRGNLLRLRPRERLRYTLDRLASLGARLGRRFVPPLCPDTQSATPPGYVAPPYPGRVTLFRALAEGQHGSCLGWERVAGGGVDVHDVPGDHCSLIHEPHAPVLAERLQACLGSVQGKRPPYGEENKEETKRTA